VPAASPPAPAAREPAKPTVLDNAPATNPKKSHLQSYFFSLPFKCLH